MKMSSDPPKMNKATQAEYEAAMQLLESICAEQRIRVNDALREIFWQGFVSGWNRSSTRTVRRDQPDSRPIGHKSTPQTPGRDSRVDSAVGRSDPPTRNNDMNQAGMFRL